MASLTKENDRGRKGWRLKFYQNKKRRSLWLGDVSKRIADGIAYNVGLLVQAKDTGMQPDAAAVKWGQSLDGRVRQTLTGWGLIEAASQRANSNAGKLLGPFIDAYIGDRTDLKPGTLTNYKQARRLLVEFFKADKPLRAITAADAERWRRWMLAREVKPATETKPAETMATATVGCILRFARKLKYREWLGDNLVARRAVNGKLGEIAMDSELTTKISAVVAQLATAEKQRLAAAGTFIELEELAIEIGDEVTRQLMNQELVDRSNQTAEASTADCPDCSSSGSPRDPLHRELQSTCGELSYHEPSFHCPSCRRNFFPSSGPNGIAPPRNGDPQDD